MSEIWQRFGLLRRLRSVMSPDRQRIPNTAGHRVAVIIPIYKTELEPLEARRVSRSVLSAAGRPVFFVGPRRLDTSWYRDAFPSVETARFADRHFRSHSSYNTWVLQPDLYRRFAEFEFVLICQTDAILYRPLPDEDWDFDYLGAPWIPAKVLGWDAKHRRLKGRSSTEKRTVVVGNGGLSLRRTSIFGTHLSFPRFSAMPQEDKAIGYFGPNIGIRIATPETATKYFMETGAAAWKIGDAVPNVIGFHALEKFNSELESNLLQA